jgi:peroxiredoxin
MAAITTAIGYIFWQQETQYWTPTEKPASLSIEIHQGDEAPLELIQINAPLQKPLLIHFFNTDCPCSRFNMKDVAGLVNQHKDEIDVIIVLQSYDYKSADLAYFNKKTGLDLPLIVDRDGKIAQAFGIYSAPQAVVVNEEGRIHFRGNYNLSRYCTKQESAFVALSIQSLLSGSKTADFGLLATTPYGCLLPSYQLAYE